MNTLFKYILKRLTEASSWVGIILMIAGAAGWELSGDQAAVIGGWIAQGVGILLAILPNSILSKLLGK